MANEVILVVEDDLQLRQVTCAYLRSEAYTVLEAGNGVQALRLWEEHRPDLIVLDWMLPGLSGLDVARTVRSRGSTPIIMLTARNEEPEIIVGLEVGADDRHPHQPAAQQAGRPGADSDRTRHRVQAGAAREVKP